MRTVSTAYALKINQTPRTRSNQSNYQTVNFRVLRTFLLTCRKASSPRFGRGRGTLSKNVALRRLANYLAVPACGTVASALLFSFQGRTRCKNRRTLFIYTTTRRVDDRSQTSISNAGLNTKPSFVHVYTASYVHTHRCTFGSVAATLLPSQGLEKLFN